MVAFNQHAAGGEENFDDVDAALAPYGLTVELLHFSFDPGRRHALSRTSLAAPNARGTDIFQDSFETLGFRLTPYGWVRDSHYYRLISPDQDFQLSLRPAANLRNRATVWIRPESDTAKQVRGNRNSEPGLFPLVSEDVESPSRILLLLHELEGESLHLALAEPGEISKGGTVKNWKWWIDVPSIHPSGEEGDGPIIDFGDEDGPDGDDFEIRPR